MCCFVSEPSHGLCVSVLLSYFHVHQVTGVCFVVSLYFQVAFISQFVVSLLVLTLFLNLVKKTSSSACSLLVLRTVRSLSYFP